MKRIGMITIYRKNYGAFLQAYALQQTLIMLGYDPEIIRYDYYRDRSVLGIPLTLMSQPIRFLKRIVVEVIKHCDHRIREKVFERSILKHIKESTSYYRSYRSLKVNPPQYDVYLTGSDQVFNSDLTPHAFEARMLCFAKNGKRASYAASAGGPRLKEKYAQLCVSALKEFEHISVRESGLKDHLTQVHGLDAKQHIDPTFLLTKDAWQKFGTCDTTVAGDYIFYYRVQQQPELNKKAAEISKTLKLPIFVADGNDCFENQVSRTHVLSPEEWVGKMDKAAYVVTNSFHGAAFAINLGKRVSVVIPPQDGERLNSLLKKCNLTNVTEQAVMADDTERIYAEANAYITQERNRANEYLREL